MAKISGGTRTYNAGTATHQKRLAHFNLEYGKTDTDRSRSFFDHKSGGYVLVNKDHNQIVDHSENKEDIAVKALAARGYKIELLSEKKPDSVKSIDGTINGKMMDIKTVNSAGKYTVKNTFLNAIDQGARNVILYQNNEKIDKDYIVSRIEKFKKQYPDKARQIDVVYIVGLSGKVHRRKMN